MCAALDAVTGIADELISEVLTAIEHGSLLVSPRRDDARENQIAAFIARLRGWLEKGAPNRLDELDELVRTERLVQRGYRAILSTFASSSAANLGPALHIWSVLARAHAELVLLQRGLEASMKQRYEESSLFIETGSIHASMPDDTTVPADEYTAAIVGVTASALKMFAYEFSWFERDGAIRLTLPPEIPVDAVEIAGGTLALGAVWASLHGFKTNHRYFGGSVAYA